MKKDEFVTYRANDRRKTSFFKTWILMAKNIIKSRELIWQLYKRDFFASYKKSYIGLGWLFISPLVGIVSWVFLNQAGILSPGDVGIPYPAFVLIGSSLWGLFMGFYTSAAGTLTAGEGFITQVKYPHEALLIKQAIHHFSAYMLTFIFNIIVLIAFGITPAWEIIFFPLIILPMFFLGAAMGLVISVISVVASDISNIVGMSLGFIFYITPIVYTAETKSKFLRSIIEINPLTYLINGARDLIIYGHVNHPDRFLAIAVGSFILFLLALRLFYVSENKVVEKMI